MKGRRRTAEDTTFRSRILVLPWIGSDDYVSAVRASADRYPTYAWLGLAGALTLAPAAIGVAMAVWRTGRAGR
jgi:hypothetical protein